MRRAALSLIPVAIAGLLALGLSCSSAQSKPPANNPFATAAAKHSTPHTRGPKPFVRPWTAPALPENEVNFLSMGDWGADSSEQKKTASIMAAYARKSGVHFNAMLLAGDNFYVKLPDGADDYLFQKLFEDMYDAKSLNFPFYAALGNHDFEESKWRFEIEYARIHPDSRWKIPARYYRLQFPAQKPFVTVLMLDSNRPNMKKEDWARETDWIDDQLAAADTPWTICVAHHPLYSNGSHGDNGVMQVDWGPLFKKHDLDFYICGHDHDIQHLQVPGVKTTFLLTGGGGRKPTEMRRDVRGPFSRSLGGFAHLQLFPDHAVVRFIGAADGAVVHQFIRDANDQVTVVETTGRDKPTSKPLKAVHGFGENDDPATRPATQKGADK